MYSNNKFLQYAKETQNIKKNWFNFKSLFRSIIDYSSMPLLFFFKTNLKKIERLQNKALEVITGNSIHYTQQKKN